MAGKKEPKNRHNNNDTPSNEKHWFAPFLFPKFERGFEVWPMCWMVGVVYYSEHQKCYTQNFLGTYGPSFTSGYGLGTKAWIVQDQVQGSNRFPTFDCLNRSFHKPFNTHHSIPKFQIIFENFLRWNHSPSIADLQSFANKSNKWGRKRSIRKSRRGKPNRPKTRRRSIRFYSRTIAFSHPVAQQLKQEGGGGAATAAAGILLLLLLLEETGRVSSSSGLCWGKNEWNMLKVINMFWMFRIGGAIWQRKSKNENSIFIGREIE